MNASLVIVPAWLLLRTTAAVLFSPLHIKIYPPSLWDNGYIWWAGVECERLSWGSLFLDYLQSLGDEHSFSALISIVMNASLVIVPAWLLLRTTAAVLISPLHIKIYPPSLWDNGYIWWAGVDSDHRSQVTTDLQSVPFGRSGTYPYMELAIGIEPTTC